MKFFTNKNVVQKIVIALLIVILCSFVIPKPSQAGWLGSNLLKELIHLIADLRRYSYGFYESLYVRN